MERRSRPTGGALLAAASVCLATGAYCLAASALFIFPAAASADERGPDPQTVFSKVHLAYAQERSHQRTIRYEQQYFSAIVAAGRAYARLRPSDSEYGKLAVLTVQIGTQLHYNPLMNRDAAPWWVREAAQWVSKNSKNINLVRGADELIIRVDAMYLDLKALAKYADEDAAAVLREHPHETDIKLIQAEANWRAWLLTNDTTWRDRALARAAKAGVIADRFPRAIFREPSDNLSVFAPADEYFGRMNYSMLGIENAERNINAKIDGGDDPADQESLALLVADSLCDMQKTYPADPDMTKLLFEGYTLLNRIATPAATTAANKIRTLLTVEYQDAPESTQLLQTTTATTNGSP